ncbi:MAG TPA: hypothetical protein VFA16_02765 [Mycobacterium sp.]|uniref:hypothetical protein n=1 Tax=Mycobacterium sp. TaxID=1785 RepID=UPI002D3462B5|nr:hypothetical protein [Mycobacterium sp.]HZU46172.1 hypothetical protein [Mycobacterium sp.]
MTDCATSEAYALIVQTRRYVDDAALLPGEHGAVLARIAAFVACQRGRPFTPVTSAELLAINFAEDVLAWLQNPASAVLRDKWVASRAVLLDAARGESA